METIRRFRRDTQRAQWGCIDWTGTRRKRYGTFQLARGSGYIPAHCASWIIYHGEPIPAGLVVDHLCCNTVCVHPFHLDPVTEAENGRRVLTPAPGWEPVPEMAALGLTRRVPVDELPPIDRDIRVTERADGRLEVRWRDPWPNSTIFETRPRAEQFAGWLS